MLVSLSFCLYIYFYKYSYLLILIIQSSPSRCLITFILSLSLSFSFSASIHPSIHPASTHHPSIHASCMYPSSIQRERESEYIIVINILLIHSLSYKYFGPFALMIQSSSYCYSITFIVSRSLFLVLSIHQSM